MNRYLVQPAPMHDIRGEVEFTTSVKTAHLTLNEFHTLALKRVQRMLPKVREGQTLPVSIERWEGKYDPFKDLTHYKVRISWGTPVPAVGKGAPAGHRRKTRVA